MAQYADELCRAIEGGDAVNSTMALVTQFAPEVAKDPSWNETIAFGVTLVESYCDSQNATATGGSGVSPSIMVVHP